MRSTRLSSAATTKQIALSGTRMPSRSTSSLRRCYPPCARFSSSCSTTPSNSHRRTAAVTVSVYRNAPGSVSSFRSPIPAAGSLKRKRTLVFENLYQITGPAPLQIPARLGRIGLGLGSPHRHAILSRGRAAISGSQKAPGRRKRLQLYTCPSTPKRLLAAGTRDSQSLPVGVRPTSRSKPWRQPSCQQLEI